MTTVMRDGAELHYDDLDRRLAWLADGGPIVFHHGVGSRAEAWAGWDAVLADRHRLVRLDMRGHGRSLVPAGDPWTLDALVEDLAAVVDAAGLDCFHLVGESIGGTIALAYAARDAGRVRTLTVSNGAHRGAPIRNLAPWAAVLETGGGAAWSAHMMPLRFHDGVLDPLARRWFEEQQAGADPAGVLALAATLAATDLTPQLAAVTMPTMLLHPDRSPFIPVSLMAELFELLPDARLEVVAGARHGLPFSHADHCSRAVAAFLAGCGA